MGAIQITGSNTFWNVNIFRYSAPFVIENEKRRREQIPERRLASQRVRESRSVGKTVVVGQLRCKRRQGVQSELQLLVDLI